MSFCGELNGREIQAGLLLSNSAAEMYSCNIVKPLCTRSHVGGIWNSIVYLTIVFHFAVTVFIENTFIQRKTNLLNIASS